MSQGGLSLKVLLVNPPVLNIIESEVPKKFGEIIEVLPPLGLMYLSSYAKSKTPHTIEILDCIADNLSHDDIRKIIAGKAPDMVGVRSTTHNFLDALYVCRAAKETLKKVFTCVGGPHVTSYASETMTFPEVDSVIVGEGEESFVELLNYLETGEPVKSKGSVFIKGVNEVKDVLYRIMENLDEIPYPDWTGLDINKYFNLASSSKRLATIITTRGCPFKCIFCNTPRSRIRMRSVENILDEIRLCKERGIKDIFIIDDTFNLKKDRVKELCRGMIRERMNLRWSFKAKVNQVDEELLALAREAGCIRIQFGVETGTDEGLKFMKKGISTDDIRNAFRLSRKAGIETVAYFIIGNPYEKTIQDIYKSVDFALSIDPDYALFGILAIYPDTELYNMAKVKKVISDDIWRNYALNPTIKFITPVWDEYFSRDELVKILMKVNRRFYYRPRVIFRNLKKITSPMDLVNKVRFALSMMKK